MATFSFQATFIKTTFGLASPTKGSTHWSWSSRCLFLGRQAISSPLGSLDLAQGHGYATAHLGIVLDQGNI